MDREDKIDSGRAHDGEKGSEEPAASAPAKTADDEGGSNANEADVNEPAETLPQISIEDFLKIDLRIARVLEVEPHPKADRLLRLQIDLGSERRQLVAGLAEHYTPEDLIGRQIVVVANLKPAKLRGEVSQGMLLAAAEGSKVVVLGPSAPIAPGSQVR